jgi:hypothetical protein
MKKSILLASLLLAVLTFSACGEATPRSLTENFWSAMVAGNYKKAATIRVESSSHYAEMLEEEGGREKVISVFESAANWRDRGGYSSFEITKEAINGDKVEVIVDYVIGNGYKSKDVYYFKKIDGKWKFN